MSQSSPIFYAFIDERFEESTTHSRFIVACSFFHQSRWDAQYQKAVSIDQTNPKHRIQAIAQVLQHSDGLAVLTYADVPAPLAQAGEIDGTDDIPSMARRDNLWSQLVLSAVAAAVACLHGAPLTKLEIDVLYDPKSLTPEHRLAFEKMLRATLPQIVEDMIEFLGRTAPVYFRRIEGVRKRKPGEKSNAFQEGINVSHHLCAQSKHLIAGGGEARVVIRNHTDVILSMISEFL
jgi:hypothetical protein